MSHHFDSAADRADGRINPCDLYAFPGASGTTVLIVTVNPDAGRSTPTTFRPDALYEFVIASDGSTSEDITFRVTFTEPDDAGGQEVMVLRADGPAARRGTRGTILGEGSTGEVFSLADNGLAWAGLAADPFTADGIAILEFNQALREGRYVPEVFTASPGNAFGGRDVTAIALQMPDAAFIGTRLALWARVSLTDHTPERQVNRIGQAMFRPLFFNPPASETELDALNAAHPDADLDTCSERVHSIAGTVARLARLPNPDDHAAQVAAAFLPDVVIYRPGQPAVFHPGTGNGRALDDNAFDTAVAVLAGSTLANASTPREPTASFPYLSAPQPADLPPLSDYFRSPQSAAQ
jgi:hypothetical protein